MTPDYSQGDALRFMDQTAVNALKALKALKAGHSTELNGTARESRNSLGTLLTIFGVPTTCAVLARRAVPVANTTKAQEATAGHEALAAK